MINELESIFKLLKNMNKKIKYAVLSPKEYEIIIENINEMKDDLNNLKEKISEVCDVEIEAEKQLIVIVARLNVFLVDIISDVTNIHRALSVVARKVADKYSDNSSIKSDSHSINNE